MSTSPRQNIDHIIEACKKKNQASCKQLYQMFKNSLFSICLRYCSNRSEAEDWLQESFISIFKNLHQFDKNKGSFYTWASRIVVNTILMHKRKQRIDFSPIENVVPIAVSFEDSIVDQMQYRDLVKNIQLLPNGFKTVFNLYEIEGYNHREISDILGISVSTSKTQLMRAKLALKKTILQQNELCNNQNGLKNLG